MKIITTIGTSLFENYMLKNENRTPALSYIKHIKEQKCHFLDYFSEEERIEEIKKCIKDWEDYKSGNNLYLSAEINSLCRIIKDLETHVEIHLITTDSVLSVLAADLIKFWFECFYKNQVKITFSIPENFEAWDDNHLHIIKDLQIYSGKGYQNGFHNLLNALNKATNENDETILNITGGYKAIIPVITIFSQLKNIPIKYLYNEGTDNDDAEIITIHNTLLGFDWTLIEENFYAFEECRWNKQENNLPTEDEFLELLGRDKGLLNLLLNERNLFKRTKNGGRIALTYLGEFAFKKYEELYDKEHFKRLNLFANLVELKIFEFWSANPGVKNIVNGKKIGENKNEVDLFIEEENNVIRVIEVKPGGNIPINTIKSQLKSGGFRKTVETNNADKFIYDLYLYHTREIAEKPKKLLEDLFSEFRDTFNKPVELNAYRLKLGSKSKKDFNWKVSKDKIEKII